MLIADYRGMDKHGQRTEGTQMIPAHIGKSDMPAIEREIKRRNYKLNTVEVIALRERV